MRSSMIFYKYVTRRFLQNLLIVGLILLLVIVLLDFAKLNTDVRDTDISFISLVILQIIKIPSLMDTLLPYALLWSCMITFNKFNIDKELVIARAIGLNARQIIMPIVSASFILGVIACIIFNPLGVISYKKFMTLLNGYRHIAPMTVNIGKTGIWLREGTKNGYQVIKGSAFSEKNMTMKNPSIIELDHNDLLTNFYSAQTAQLKNHHWILKNVSNTTKDNKNTWIPYTFISTNMTISSLKKLFQTAKTTSFWQLLDRIAALKNAGLNAREYEFEFQYLISTPLLFASLAMFAFFFVGTIEPRQMTQKRLFIGSLAGFCVFFYINLIKSLSTTTILPIYILGWLGSVSMFFLSLYLLLFSERMAK